MPDSPQAKETWRDVAPDLLIQEATALGCHPGRPTHISPTRRGPRVPDRHVRPVIFLVRRCHE
jgi:hypothetical protein